MTSHNLHPAEQRYRAAKEKYDAAREARNDAVREELEDKTVREVAKRFGLTFQRVARIGKRG